MIRLFIVGLLSISIAGCATKEVIAPFYVSTGGNWDSRTEFRLHDCGPLNTSDNHGSTGYLVGMIASGVLGLKVLTDSKNSGSQFLGLTLLGAGGYLYYLWSSNNKTYSAVATGNNYKSDVTLNGCVVEFPYPPGSNCRFITLEFKNGSTIRVDLKDPIIE